MENIKNYISRELDTLSPEEMLDNATARRFTHPWGYAYSTDHHIDNGDYTQEALDICENQLDDVVADYYTDICIWIAEDMRNNPEEYDLTAEDIDDDAIYEWDEEGTVWMKFNNYVATLIQEAIEEF